MGSRGRAVSGGVGVGGGPEQLARALAVALWPVVRLADPDAAAIGAAATVLDAVLADPTIVPITDSPARTA